MKLKQEKRPRSSRVRRGKIEVNNIFYDFVIGLSQIAVSTSPIGQYAPLPDYAKVHCSVDTPDGLVGLGANNKEVRRSVERIIRARVELQRQTVKGQ